MRRGVGEFRYEIDSRSIVDALVAVEPIGSLDAVLGRVVPMAVAVANRELPKGGDLVILLVEETLRLVRVAIQESLELADPGRGVNDGGPVRRIRVAGRRREGVLGNGRKRVLDEQGVAFVFAQQIR